MAFEAIFKLFTMLLQFIGQATPLDAQQEHPVNRLLQRFMSTSILIELAHTLLTMAQVKRLFLVYFHKGTPPRPKGRALVDITEQDIAHPVVECVGNDEFHPAVQGDIKGIWILKIPGVAFKKIEFLSWNLGFHPRRSAGCMLPFPRCSRLACLLWLCKD